MRRAQTAMEFVILIGFMLFVFTTFFLVIQERSSIIKQEIYRRDLDGVAQLITNEIALAQQVRFGYIREFTLPLKLSGENYTVTLNNGSEVTIRRDISNDEFVVFLPSNLYLSNYTSSCYCDHGDLLPGVKYSINKLRFDGNDSVGMYDEVTTGLRCAGCT